MSSLDREFRFICALLKAPKNDQEDFYLAQIPISVFKIRDREMHWVYRYREKYGVYPSSKAFTQKFNERVKLVKDPLKAVLEPILDLDQYNQIKELVEGTKTLIDEGKEMKFVISHVQSASDRLKTYSVEYQDSDLNNSNKALLRYQKLLKAKKNNNKDLFTTPWAAMNTLIKFMRPKELAVLSARLNLGKTWIMLALAIHLSDMAGIDCLVISKEMSTEALEDRVEAIRFNIPWDRMREGSLSKAERLARKRAKLKFEPKGKLIVSGEETIEGVGDSHVVSKVSQYKPQFVFVDGAYLIEPDHLRRASEREKMVFVSRFLKRLAKTTNTAVFATVQQNRDAESKDGVSKGSVGNVFGSDSWGQDADFLFGIGGKRGSSERLVQVMKGRDSAVGEFYINFLLNDGPDFSEKTGVSAAQAQASGVSTNNKTPFSKGILP